MSQRGDGKVMRSTARGRPYDAACCALIGPRLQDPPTGEQSQFVSLPLGPCVCFTADLDQDVHRTLC